MTQNAAVVVMSPWAHWIVRTSAPWPRAGGHGPRTDGASALIGVHLTGWEALAQQAVAAAQRAGARYADARLTRTLCHPLRFAEMTDWTETTGVGVRALVDGHWGFAAAPGGDTHAVEQLARDAVAQAKSDARGLPRTVELAATPAAVGHWTMPVKIDPFSIPFEEKLAVMQSWMDLASVLGLRIDTTASDLHFLRQERVVATSDGARFTQTVYESGGRVIVSDGTWPIELDGFTPMGKGWELALDANVPAQLGTAAERIAADRAARRNPKPVEVGRYTLVCDGGTMAALLDRTFAVATQLDRALGYEANTSGTSFLHDPLGMLGTFAVTSPVVTVTANRSAPGQLATVRWDDEGVVPEDFTIIKNGVLVDYQTTREQAAWLAPYYQRIGTPVRSHGCAAADHALVIPMQQLPNIALEGNTTPVTVDDLIANAKTGILLTDGDVITDFQSRTGVMQGTMREITNGKVGRPLMQGAVLFDTLELWKHVTAVGGFPTQRVAASSWYPYTPEAERFASMYPVKGEPPERTSASIQAVAAMIENQSIVDIRRKA
jgi:TldD protein